jgi:hypothetical protein
MVLDPNGLRKNVLAERLTPFNETLAEVCDMGGWPPILLNEWMEIRGFGDFPYAGLSRAQKYIVNATMQIALTSIDKSKVIILDDFEVLDSELASGLMHVLASIPIRSVIGCKFSSVSQVPYLGGNAITYWCEAGKALKLETVPA